MSYPVDEIDEEEIDTVELENNGKEVRTVRKKNRFTEVYESKHWGKVWVAFLCCFVFFIIFFLVWIGLFNTQQNTNTHHMHQIESQLKSSSPFRTAQQYVTNGLYSLASVFATRQESSLSLCHQAMYKPMVVQRQEVLVPGDSIERTRALLQRRITAQDKQYMVKTRFDLHYNIDVGKEGGAQADQLYQTVHYEVATNYAQFSTVKLLVTSEDIYKKVPRLRQEIVICSNKPGSSRQCSRRTTVDNLMLMNNTLRVPMEQPSQTVGNTTGAHTEGEDLQMDAAQSLKQLERDIASNRLFHILFYREASDNSETLGRDDVDEYNEYLALIIEPSTC